MMTVAKGGEQGKRVSMMCTKGFPPTRSILQLFLLPIQRGLWLGYCLHIVYEA